MKDQENSVCLLNEQQTKFYENNGYLLIEEYVDLEQVQLLRNEIERFEKMDSPRRVLERDHTMRSFFGADQINAIYDEFTRSARMYVPCRQLLDGEIYIHQTKLNTKPALYGEWWEWHQDFTFWYLEDHILKPHLVSVMVFLDDVSEFNGPMYIVPGSHTAGIVNEARNGIKEDSTWYSDYQKSETYLTTLTSNLRYTIDKETLKQWLRTREIISIKGKAGSILFFHPLLFHSSPNNLSPIDRFVYIVTYNLVSNKPKAHDNPRPDFICSRNFEPIA